MWKNGASLEKGYGSAKAVPLGLLIQRNLEKLKWYCPERTMPNYCLHEYKTTLDEKRGSPLLSTSTETETRKWVWILKEDFLIQHLDVLIDLGKPNLEKSHLGSCRTFHRLRSLRWRLWLLSGGALGHPLMAWENGGGSSLPTPHSAFPRALPWSLRFSRSPFFPLWLRHSRSQLTWKWDLLGMNRAAIISH